MVVVGMGIKAGLCGRRSRRICHRMCRFPSFFPLLSSSLEEAGRGRVDVEIDGL